MSIEQIDDILQGQNQCLAIFCSILIKMKDGKDKAISMYVRNKLEVKDFDIEQLDLTPSAKKIEKILSEMTYTPNQFDIKIEDGFYPISDPKSEYMHLPKEIKL